MVEERGDGIRDDVRVWGVLLGELENGGKCSGDFSAGGVLEVRWGWEVEGLIGGWVLGLELRAGIWARHRLWFGDLPTTILLRPPFSSINFLSLSIHHEDLPRGLALNRIGRIWKRRCDITFLTEIRSHSFKLLKKLISSLLFWPLVKRNEYFNICLYQGWKKSPFTNVRPFLYLLLAFSVLHHQHCYL